MELKKKIELFKKELKKYNRLLVAYSGGVDSSLLLRVACDELGRNNIIAVTAKSLTYTKRELNIAKRLAVQLKVRHLVIDTDEFNNEDFLANSPVRCYYCKKELFKKLDALKKKYECDAVATGANYDDRKDYRPGTKAEEEFGIASPLKDAHFTKDNIREYSKQLCLPTYNLPSLACLSSRVPYNERITEELIDKIRKAEDFLFRLDLGNLRVRTSNDTARIEVDAVDFDKIINNREKIINYFRKIGYTFITLDIEGFRSGSMNKAIKRLK